MSKQARQSKKPDEIAIDQLASVTGAIGAEIGQIVDRFTGGSEGSEIGSTVDSIIGQIKAG